MALPILIVVVTVPLAAVADADTIATLMLLVFAAGVGWLLWRRK